MVAIFGINGANAKSSGKAFAVGHQVAHGKNRTPDPSAKSLINIGTGSNGDAMSVDVASGNLILQDQDGLAVSRGLDVNVTRTYNSQGEFTDGSQDTWWMNGSRKITNLTGKENKQNSTIQRVGETGVATTYTYDSSSGSYRAAAGSGDFNTLTYDSNTKQWTWTDAETQTVEVYEANGNDWQLVSSTDANGNTSTYAYTANLLTSITDASGETVEFSYTNKQLTREAIREADGSYRSCTEYSYDDKGRLIQTRLDLSPEDNSTADGNVHVTSYSYYDNTGLVSTVTQGDGSKVSLTYVTSGGVTRVASVTDALGRVTSFSYDTAAHTTTVTDALGNQSVYTYNANNSLAKVVGPALDGVSEQMSYEYDNAGDVIRMTNGAGYEVRYTYDANGNRITETDSLGNRIERTYDGSNHVLTETVYRVPQAGQQAASQPETTRYVYDANGNLRFQIDAEGGVTENRYDSYGQKLATLKYPQAEYNVASLGVAQTPSLNAMAQWAAGVNPQQATRVDFTYNNRGQVVAVTNYQSLNPDGTGVSDGTESTTSYVYDVAGNLLLKVDPNKQQTSYVYDGLNRVLSSTDALGNVTTNHYDDINHVVTHTQANGRVDTDVYDADGELLSSLVGGVARTEYRYDALGRMIESIDPTGVKVQYVYDAAGHLAAEVDGEGRVTQYAYNVAGDRVQTIHRATELTQAQMDALEASHASLAGMVQNSATDQISYSLLDAKGRLAKQIDAAGYVTEYQYDGAGNRIATVQYANAVDTSKLSAASGPEEVQVVPSAQDRTTHYYFDNNNRVIGSVDAEGYVTQYRYDAAGRQIEAVRFATRTSGTPQADGNFAGLIPAASPADQHSYTLYDGEDHVTGKVDAEGYLTEYGYDADGQLVRTVRYANRVTGAVAPGMDVGDLRPAASSGDLVSTQTYDAMGRVSSATNAEGTRTDYMYDVGGNLVSTVAAVGTGEMRRVDQRFNALGRLTGVLSPRGAALLAGAKTPDEVDAIWDQYGTTYSYDAAGRRTSSTDPNGNRTLYYYDRSGNLTHAINSIGEVQELRFDGLGNPVELIQYGTRLPSFAGLNGGLVDSALTTALSGIADPAKDSVMSASYDKDGRMVTLIDALGGTTTYAYDAFGEQVSSTQSIDGTRVLTQTAQYDKLGDQVGATNDGVAASAEYDAFGRVVRTVDGNGNATVQTYDRLGRVIAVQDPTNALRQSTYDAFGRVLTQTDATGHATTYAYDNANRSMTVTTAEGVSMSVVRNRSGQVQSITDGNGNVTSYSYDADGNLVDSGNALSHTHNGYDAGGRLIETVDANGNVVHYTYDAANRVLSKTVDPDGLALPTTYQYDAKGQQVATTDANGVLTTTTYDLKGQVVEQVVDPDGMALTTRYSYDQRGKVLTVTNPGGVVTQYVYDVRGRRIEEHLDPAGLNETKRYSYDNDDNLVAATDALGNVTRYAYDADNRLVYTVDAAGDVRKNIYDANGRVTAAVAYAQPISLDGLGEQATAAEIDARVRATPGQDATEQRVYDKDGHVRYTIDGAGGVIGFTCDGNGKVIDRVSYANRIDLNAWVPGTAPAVVADPAHDVRVRTVYDANNRAIYQIDGTGAVTEARYDGNGNVVETVSYANRIALDTPATASAIAAALMADNAHDHHVLLRYDHADRLVESTDATGVNQQYVYDAMGRLLAQVDGGGRVTQYVYNAAGERVQTVRRAVALTDAQMAALEADPASLAGMVQDSSADQVSFTLYDDAGRVAKVIDPNGFVTEHRYDAAGNLVATVQYSRAVDTSALTASSQPQDVAVTESPDDRTTYYYYDDKNERIGMVDAEGYVTAYHYDAAGRLTETVAHAIRTAGAAQQDRDFASLVPPASVADQHTYALYDGEGRVTGVVDAEGYLTENGYDADGNLVRTVRYANRVTQAATAGVTVDGLRPEPSAQDQVSTQIFDGVGRKLSATNAEGTRTEYQYDADGRLTAAVAAAGASEARTTTQQFDALGQVTAVQGERNGISYTYDAAGRRTSSTDANGNRTIYYYNRSGQLTHTINALGEVEERRYDALGEQVAVVSHGNRLPSLDGLNGGLVDAALLAALAGIGDGGKDSVTTASYDKAGQVVEMTDAMGGTTAYTYDGFGDVVQRTTSIDATDVLTETAQYDKRGEQVEATTDGVATTGEYDAFGRVVRMVDANGNATVQEYDRLGRLVTIEDPTHAVRKSSYDAFARQLSQTDATGNTTTYTYDDASRSMTVRTAEGVMMSVVHDRHGETQSITDGNGNVTTYSYDADGNLVDSGNALGQTHNSYDAGGRLIESVDANGNVVRYTYDAANRTLSRTVDPDGLALTTAYQYDAKGQQVSATDANGVVTTTAYDLKGQVVEQVVDPAGLALTTRYSYDQRGNVLTVTKPGGLGTQYVYDAQGRRVEEHVDPNGLDQTTRYSYDNNGNLVAATDPLGNVTRYAYDADNRLVYTVDAAGNVKQNSYDAAGRVTAKETYARPIALEGLGQHVGVAEIAARVAATPGQDASPRLVYDKDGHVRYTVDGEGGVTAYRYDSNGNVTERIGYANRIDLASWVPGTDPVVVSDPAHDLHVRVVYDANNHAIYRIDGTGAVTETKYDANGNVVDSIAYANRIAVATPATQADVAAALIPDGEHDQRRHQVFDSANRLTWTVNGTGAVTHLVYDSDGNLIKRINYATSIDPAADPQTVPASAADRVTVVAYDHAQRPVYYVDANGGVIGQVYDAAGNVTARVAYSSPVDAPTADGGTPSANQLAATVQPDALKDRVTRMTYDAVGRNVFAMDAEGDVTENVYDGDGRLTQTIQYAEPIAADSLSLSPTNDEVRGLLQEDGEHDRKTSQIFDAAGRLVYVVDAEGYVRKNEYDGQGRLTAVTQYATKIPAGATADLSSVAAAIRPDSGADQATRYQYDTLGHVIGMTDAAGHAEQYTYDAIGQKQSFTDKNGATWNYEYDAAGRLIAESAPAVAVTAVTAGADGNLVVDEAHSGNIRLETRMTYDAFGHLASRTEAANTSQARKVKYEYDALGRQTKVIYPQVSVYDASADDIAKNGANGLASREEKLVELYAETAYDTFGNVVATRDVGGNVAYKAYDKLGLLAYDVNALGYVTGYVRNTFGNVVQTVSYASPTGLSKSSAPPSAQDVAAVLQGVQGSADRIVRANYDRLGRVVQVTEPQTWVTTAHGSMLASKVTRNFYNAFGQLSRKAVLADASTKAWASDSYYYDRDGRNTATTDALGYATARAYDAAGNVVRITEYANASTPGQQQLALPAESAKDRTTVYAYDALNRRVSETRLNVEFSEGSDNSAGVVRGRGDVTTTYAYDSLGNLTVVTDALGGSTVRAYDALGRLTSVKSPSVAGLNGPVEPLTVYRRDAFGNAVVTIEFANGAAGGASVDDRITVARFDSAGHATQMTDANGVSHFASYDAAGHVRKQWQAVTSSDGAEHTLFTVLEYDAAGRVTAMVTPGSDVMYDRKDGKIHVVDQSTVAAVRREIEYNAFGEIIRQADGAGKQTYYSYDNAGHLWRTSAGAGDTQVMLYDLQGNRTAVLESAGMASSSLYGDADPLVTAASAQQADQMQGLRRTDSVLDLLGRATEIIHPVRSEVRPVVQQTFDRWGNVLSRSTLNGAGIVNVYEYDANNNVIRVTEPDGEGLQSAGSPVTEFYYDRLGRQIATRDHNGNVNMQGFDAAGDLAQEAHADGGVVKHYFNAFGEEVARRDAENNLVTLQRDHLGRVVETSTDPVGAYTVGDDGTLRGGIQRIVSSTQYDEAGRVVARINGAGEKISYDVDLRGNTTAVHQPLGETDSSAYNAQGKRVAHTDANGATETWDFDANGRLQSRTDIGGSDYDYVYDSAGQLVQQTNSLGQYIRTTYDAAGQVTQVRDFGEDKTTLYSYNLAGQHTREVTVQRGLLYQDNAMGYDTHGRLARIDAVADGVFALMEYDAVGNLLHQKESAQARSSGTLLEQLPIDGKTLTVARGIATRGASTRDQWYAYDSMNRQVMIEGAANRDAADANNLAEMQGQLATYDKNGNITSTTYQGSQLVAQIGADGRTHYVVHQGQVKMYYRYDAAGRLTETAVGAVDAQGNALNTSYATVVSQNYYDAAGRLVQSGAGSNLPAEYAQAALANQESAYRTDLTVKQYDADGRLLRARITHLNGQLLQDTNYAGGYDAVGNALSYKFIDANGSVGTTSVSLVRQDGYRRTGTTTTKVAPNGVAAVTRVAYTYDTAGSLVHIDTVSAKGEVASRDLFNDLSGHILQTKDGDQVINRLVVDGHVYATWAGQGATSQNHTMLALEFEGDGGDGGGGGGGDYGGGGGGDYGGGGGDSGGGGGDSGGGDSGGGGGDSGGGGGDSGGGDSGGGGGGGDSGSGGGAGDDSGSGGNSGGTAPDSGWHDGQGIQGHLGPNPGGPTIPADQLPEGHTYHPVMVYPADGGEPYSATADETNKIYTYVSPDANAGSDTTSNSANTDSTGENSSSGSSTSNAGTDGNQTYPANGGTGGNGSVEDADPNGKTGGGTNDGGQDNGTAGNNSGDGQSDDRYDSGVFDPDGLALQPSPDITRDDLTMPRVVIHGPGKPGKPGTTSNPGDTGTTGKPALGGVTSGLINALKMSPAQVFAARNSGTPIPGKSYTKTDHIAAVVGYNPAQLGMVTPSNIASNLNLVQNYVQNAANAHSVSTDLINAVITRESKGLQNAVSATGALGIAQLTYSIYGSSGAVKAFGSAINPFNAQQAIDRQAALLSQLSKHYNGNVSYTLGAYNQGQGKVDDAIADYGSDWLKHLNSEAQTYVKTISDILAGKSNIPGYFGTPKGK
ncbi:MAG: transglycosylase SLT domain-containing protein [Massilia sp.]